MRLVGLTVIGILVLLVIKLGIWTTMPWWLVFSPLIFLGVLAVVGLIAVGGFLLLSAIIIEEMVGSSKASMEANKKAAQERL